MSKMHGNNGDVTIAGTSLIGAITEWSRSVKASGIVKTTTMGDTAETHIASGLYGWSGSLSCIFDPTVTKIDALMDAIKSNASVALVLKYGKTTGDLQESGNAFIESDSVNVAMGDVIKISFSFTGTGELTQGTVA